MRDEGGGLVVPSLRETPLPRRPPVAPHLRAKPVRTASGVAVVAVMSKPHRCADASPRVCLLRANNRSTAERLPD